MHRWEKKREAREDQDFDFSISQHLSSTTSSSFDLLFFVVARDNVVVVIPRQVRNSGSKVLVIHTRFSLSFLSFLSANIEQAFIEVSLILSPT